MQTFCGDDFIILICCVCLGGRANKKSHHRNYDHMNYIKNMILYYDKQLPTAQETRQYLVWDREGEEETVDYVTTNLFKAAEGGEDESNRRGRSKSKAKRNKSKTKKARKDEGKGKKKKRKASTSTSTSLSSSEGSDSDKSSSASQSEAHHHILNGACHCK